jgi:co-chaperonin GroES (HSP10)
MEGNNYELESDVRWLNQQRQIRPLTGYALIEILPSDHESLGGILIPETSREGPINEKKPPWKGRVLALGSWSKTKSGYGILPDFGIGAIVLCSAYQGHRVGRYVGERMRLVKFDAVLAVIGPIPTTVAPKP